MTDKRNDTVLESAIESLPPGSGIVFRHYHLNTNDRARRFATVRVLAKRRHHCLLLADSPALARQWGASGVHGRHWKRSATSGLLRSAPVHNAIEIAQAKANGADLFFLSPAFATRSHSGSPSLSILQLSRLKNLCGGPVILLGGMTTNRFTQLKQLGAYGWAAIDALSS